MEQTSSAKAEVKKATVSKHLLYKSTCQDR